MLQQNEEVIKRIKNKKKENMKEIIYNKDNKILYIACDNKYKGVRYFIVAGGIHPCAYVMCPESFINKHKEDWGGLDCIHVHGGVTWTEEASHLLKHPVDCTDHCFGWDYGHAGDWAGYHSEEENYHFQNYKWSLDEIIIECESAIDQYLEAKRKDEEEMPQDDIPLTSDFLKGIGFTPAFSGLPDDEDDSLHKIGEIDGKRWRIFIDLKNPSFSYAYNQKQRRRYEGSILTLEEMKMVVDLCKLPVEV